VRAGARRPVPGALRRDAERARTMVERARAARGRHGPGARGRAPAVGGAKRPRLPSPRHRHRARQARGERDAGGRVDPGRRRFPRGAAAAPGRGLLAPVPSARRMSATRVDLMASAVGKIGGVTWHHLFLVALDASGAQSYLRAGPQCMPLEKLGTRKTQSGEAAEDYEPSPAGPYGVITFSSGAYEPGGADFDPVAANATLASGNAAAPLWDKLQAAAKALQEEQIPYDPMAKGANWALTETLR